MKTVFAAFSFLLFGLQAMGQNKNVNSSAITPALQADGTNKITSVETRLLNKEANGTYLFSAAEAPYYFRNDVRDFNSNNAYQVRRGNDMFLKGGSTTYIIDGMQVQRR